MLQEIKEIELSNFIERSRSSASDPQIKLRMPLDLKRSIEQSAEKNGRSRVAEILYRLRKSLRKELF